MQKRRPMTTRAPRANDFDSKQDAHWAKTVNLRSHDHPVVRLFAQQRVAFIREIVGSKRLRSALDVGCGDGFGMRYMQALAEAIHGCDKSRRMLDANPAGPENLTQCDAYELPWPDGSFEMVYCWELLHHLARPEIALAEMTRVATTCVVVCEPNCLNPAMALFGLAMPHERGVLRFNAFSTKKLLKQADLRSIRSQTVGYFTPNRTPEALARVLVQLPFRAPLLGLYTVAIGWKGNNHPPRPRTAS